MKTYLDIAPSASKLGRKPKSWPSLARHIAATWRQRQSLRRLDEDALKDIGLTRSVTDAEASRPIWDVPANWLR